MKTFYNIDFQFLKVLVEADFWLCYFKYYLVTQLIGGRKFYLAFGWDEKRTESFCFILFTASIVSNMTSSFSVTLSFYSFQYVLSYLLRFTVIKLQRNLVDRVAKEFDIEYNFILQQNIL